MESNQPPVVLPEQKKPSRPVLIWFIAITAVLIVGILVLFFVNKPTDSNKKDAGQTFSSRNNPNGPYAHQIYSATSSDGLTWTPANQLLFDHASVPGAIYKDGQVWLYFVDASGEQDQLSVAVSSDNGQSFGPAQQVEIEGVNKYDAVDPTPDIVNGQLRLYYLGDFMSKEKGPNEKFTMYSAASSDGIHFTSPQVAAVFDTITTDPDVFPVGDGWRMLVSQEMNMQLLTSTDGVSFSPVSGFSWSNGGVSDTAVMNGVTRTYYCGQGIQSATGANTGLLKPETGVRVQATGDKITCDPAIVTLPDRSYLMLYKTQTITQKPL